MWCLFYLLVDHAKRTWSLAHKEWQQKLSLFFNFFHLLEKSIKYDDDVISCVIFIDKFKFVSNCDLLTSLPSPGCHSELFIEFRSNHNYFVNSSIIISPPSRDKHNRLLLAL